MSLRVMNGGRTARGGPARAPQLVSVPNSTRTGRPPLVRRARARSLPCGAGAVSVSSSAAAGGPMVLAGDPVAGAHGVCLLEYTIGEVVFVLPTSYVRPACVMAGCGDALVLDASAAAQGPKTLQVFVAMSAWTAAAGVPPPTCWRSRRSRRREALEGTPMLREARGSLRAAGAVRQAV